VVATLARLVSEGTIRPLGEAPATPAADFTLAVEQPGLPA
jgi:hypothetical protein